ncbi:MAG: alpha/beta fold hydrolase [Candidatus Omnitrophica bacterium]|nr:alpha/beta fold hydrolase [Candidatus Omnitrophota bacterium]
MKRFMIFAVSFSLLFSAVSVWAQSGAEKFETLQSTKGAKINVYVYESTTGEVKEKPVLLVHGFNSNGSVWQEGEDSYVTKFRENGYDVIVVDMRGNPVDTDGDHKLDAPCVGDSWGYGVRDLGDDVGTSIIQGLDFLNKNLPGRDYKKVDVVTHSTGGLAVTSYSRSQGAVSYGNNIDTVIELAPPNNGSTSLVANIKQAAQIIPSVFTQSMVAYEYALEFLEEKVWIPGGRMESEILRKELRPESIFLKSIEGLGPDPRIKTFIAIGDEDWVVGNWSPAIEGRDDIGYEYFIGLDHFGFCNSELIIAALLDKLEKGDESSFFKRFKPYRNKSLISFLSGPGIDHPDDTFDVVTFAKGIEINPREFFDLYLRIAARKNKAYLLKSWEALVSFEKAQEEIENGRGEQAIIGDWDDLLTEKNNSLNQNYTNASKEYLECPDIAILANGYYNELTKLIIEKVGEPVRIVDHTFNPSILNEQKILFIPSGGLSGLSHSVIFRKKLSEFVKNGGTLVCLSQQHGYDFNALPPASLKGYGWQEDVSCHSMAAYIENFHQILSSQNELYPDLKIDGYFTAYPEGAEILLRRTKNLMPAMLLYDFGNGMVIVASIYSDWGYSNGQASASEINLIRDLLRWSKSSKVLPEYKKGTGLKKSIDVQKDFEKIEMLLKSPDNTVLEKKSSDTTTYESSIALNTPGIYCVDYILYNSDSEAIQPQAEGFYFSFSMPPEGSVPDPDFTFNITSDSENYTTGAGAAFTFHIKNNTSQDETVKCKALFSHHETKFTESINVPAKTQVDFDKKIVITRTDRLKADFYSSGNSFLGSAERGVSVFEPSVDVDLAAERMQYLPQQKVSITSSVRNASKAGAGLFLVLNIIDLKGEQVYYKTKSLKLSEGEDSLWNHDFVIPEDATRGIYRIKLNAYSDSKLVGSKTVNIDVPGPLLCEEEDIPKDFFELLNIELTKSSYKPGESVLAKIIINNKDEEIDAAVLDIRVLSSVETGSLSGTVKDERGTPIKGAFVNTCYANSDGKYKLEKIGKGRHVMNIRAAGYDRLSKEIDILGGDNDIDFTLMASRYGDLSGALEDSIGSRLTLEPVSAVSSDACTRYSLVSTEAKFEFKHVPVGSYTLKIEPEGILESVQIKEGENEIVLDMLEQYHQAGSSSSDPPWQGVEKSSASSELEPNNDFDSATAIDPGATMHGKMDNFGDQDYFKLSADSASILNISVKDVESGFSPHITIYNSKKWWCGATAALSGREIEYSLELAEGDTYYILLKDRYNTFSSQEMYSLEVNLVAGTDQYEPNPDFDSAKAIDIRKEIEATMFPTGDDDYFAIDIEKKGIFYSRMQNVPEGLRPSFKIYDSSRKLIWQKGGSSGEKIAIEIEIREPGRYYLLVKDWYSSFSSVEPYSFVSYFIETPDEHEPNNEKDEANPIDFGKAYFATIATNGDSDFYKLSIPDAGKIIISMNDVPSNISPYIKLYKESWESWIASTAGPAGEDIAMQFDVENPSNYFIEIEDRYNSETSLLRYRLLTVYIPDDEYAPGDSAIFKQEINVSDVQDTEIIDIRIPGIHDIGKYYLQAVLKSSNPKKNAQAVERFYVSDLDNFVEPVPSPEIELLCLEDENSVFTAGENAYFRFKAKNKGDAGGALLIDFKVRGLTSQALAEFLEPGVEKELQFEFLFPVDSEDGPHEAEYTFGGEKHTVNFKVSGVKVEIGAEFKDSILKLKVKNNGLTKDAGLFAEVRCGDFEEKKDFILADSNDLAFNIPEASGQDKIYYGIYFSSGKGLYLSSFLLGDAEIEDVLIKVVEVGCDKDTYADGEDVILKWKVDSQDDLSMRLIADLIRPDSSSAQIIDEDVDLDRGMNLLEKGIKPEFTVPGVYRILYRFIHNESVAVQGSIFFDVGEEVRIQLRLDKRQYMEDEIVKLTACIFSSFALKGNLKFFLDKKVVETREIDLDGYKEFNFSLESSEVGQHRAYCSLLYNDKIVDSNRESFTVSKKPKPNHSPVLFTIGGKAVVAGELLEFSVDAADIDGDALTYSAEGMPDAASFDSEKRRFSWRPGYGQPGVYFVTFNVSDGKASASERVKIIVKKTLPQSPQAKALAEPLKGMAPLEVDFNSQSVDRDGNIVKYEWDFDGKGVYDFNSLESGKAVFVYTGEGDFPAALRVTDNEGQTDIHIVNIDVERNPGAPLVFLEANPLKGIAPRKVYFKSIVSSLADICRYEWDFNGDGVFEACSSESGEVVKLYGTPGTYNAEFRVTSSEGLSASETVSVEISDPLVLSVEPIVSDYKGNVPVEVDFDAIIDSENPIQKYQWDFEGDGVFDFTSTSSAETRYTYFKPGAYTPILRVTDENNISRGARKEIRFGILAADNIKKGKMTAKSRKGKAPFTVGFSFDSESDGANARYFWDFEGDGLCDLVSVLPEAEHTYYDSGVYVAEVNVETGDDFIRQCREMIYVTNGKKNAGQSYALNNSELRRKKSVCRDKLYRIELSDRTCLILPAGILEADDEVDIKKLEEHEIYKMKDLEENIAPAGEYREYKFGNHKSGFNKEMTISIPYIDENGDGFIDDKNIDELTLDAYWFDEAGEEWKLVSDALIFPKENLVTIKTNHFSIFGITGIQIESDGDPEPNPASTNCFIATAAFGTSMAEEVQVLCKFRDEHLLKSEIGRRLVCLYYRHSPPIARFIRDKPLLKSLIRTLLKNALHFSQ